MFSFQNFLNNKITDILPEFVKEVEDWDENFFQNRSPEEKERYKVSKKRNRTVNTEIGFATFNRRIYWDNIEKRTRYFTDEEFNIEKRARVIKDLKLKILSNLIKNLITKKTYTHIQSEYEYTYFSKNFISRLFKNAKIEKFIPEEKFKVLDNQKLNICADDAFITCWDENGLKQQYCCRILTFNQGKKEIYSYRNKLQNKITAFLLFKSGNGLNQEQLYNFTTQTILNHYDIKLNILGVQWEYHNYNLVVAGDGALWIKAMATWLGCYYILDKYHAYSYLWKSFVGVKVKKKESHDWTKYIDGTTTFASGDCNQLLSFLKPNVNEKVYNYFKNNAHGIVNQNASWNIGCSAESDVYHFLKSLTNGAKIYNFQTLNNMLIAKANYLNTRSYINSA
ncbi:Mbov_0401 family ICE element transposase-like protein [Spiroplasma endosymbiont of Dasysyrphus albostriatus]|uniref:Mbov_0401 family ICE element transposase-like protein n=1 Tax=Spiroplasma endosymbiont of Dasysyrphus albostriatus TaxID=3066299 RepID=UPI0030D21FD7